MRMGLASQDWRTGPIFFWWDWMAYGVCYEAEIGLQNTTITTAIRAVEVNDAEVHMLVLVQKKFDMPSSSPADLPKLGCRSTVWLKKVCSCRRNMAERPSREALNCASAV